MVQLQYVGSVVLFSPVYCIHFANIRFSWEVCWQSSLTLVFSLGGAIWRRINSKAVYFDTNTTLLTVFDSVLDRIKVFFIQTEKNAKRKTDLKIPSSTGQLLWLSQLYYSKYLVYLVPGMAGNILGHHGAPVLPAQLLADPQLNHASLPLRANTTAAAVRKPAVVY